MAYATPAYKRQAGIGQLFNYMPMKLLANYLATHNGATQVLAIDGTNAENIQTTGGGAALFNGLPVDLPADAELDISADTEGTLTAWATATAYTMDNIRKNKNGERFRCIQAHTSSPNDEPGLSPNWETYWERSYHEAVNGVGSTIGATGYSRWWMVTAKIDGTITVWNAGDAALDGYEELKVPVYDPKEYCVIGYIHVNATGAFTLGTTALTTIGTFYQHIGPCIPHPDNLRALKC